MQFYTPYNLIVWCIFVHNNVFIPLTNVIGASLSEPHTCRKTFAVTVYIYVVCTFRIYACSNLTLAVQYLPMHSAHYVHVQCFVFRSDTLSMSSIEDPPTAMNAEPDVK